MPEDHSSLNFAEILYPYLKNRRIINKDGSEVTEGVDTFWDDGGKGKRKKNTKDDEDYDVLVISVSAPKKLNKTALYVVCDLDIKERITTV